MIYELAASFSSEGFVGSETARLLLMFEVIMFLMSWEVDGTSIFTVVVWAADGTMIYMDFVSLAEDSGWATFSRAVILTVFVSLLAYYRRALA